MKCISTYEDVMVGDTGPVMKIENEGLHDLNVRVRNLFPLFLACFLAYYNIAVLKLLFHGGG